MKYVERKFSGIKSILFAPSILLLAGALFECYSSVVLTSATLTVAASATSTGNATAGFEHISKRLGLTLAR